MTTLKGEERFLHRVHREKSHIDIATPFITTKLLKLSFNSHRFSQLSDTGEFLKCLWVNDIFAVLVESVCLCLWISHRPLMSHLTSVAVGRHERTQFASPNKRQPASRLVYCAIYGTPQRTTMYKLQKAGLGICR